jgi:potassium-transporting ATPase potassium-binding subunit
MTGPTLVQFALYLVVLVALVKPLGLYMAHVFQGERTWLDRVLGPLERALYRFSGIKAEVEMGWRTYAAAFLAFHVVSFLAVYLIQRVQAFLPLNPAGMSAVSPDLSFNTAISFMTNTNWQSYGGESTMSYLTQMLALTVQNFVSAAAGIAVLVALARGLARKTSETIGNFWADLVRGTLYVLLPLSVVMALFLVSQGTVQTLSNYATVPLVDATTGADNKPVTEQVIALGPAASQIAIKQLGTNGGGFFNVNSAHPFENPTPLTNFVEALAILLISAALCYTFGVMVGARRQGWTLLVAMLVIFIPLLLWCGASEQGGNPNLRALGVDDHASAVQPGGNMEGKEARLGISNSALWAVATTAASNGSVNSMHDSFMPLGGLVAMWLIQLGEIVFGGVGSGLYGMIVFAIVSVFVAGLMVGRTPEYLGKKVEAFEIKMAALVILIPACSVLVGAGVAVVYPPALASLSNPGPHGFSQILYAFSSASNNNGSAFGGLNPNVVFYNSALGIAMFLGRFGPALPVLAMAGSLARKKRVPEGPGTLPTDTPLFVAMLVSVILIVGALTFLPALALGPIAEHLQLSR